MALGRLPIDTEKAIRIDYTLNGPAPFHFHVNFTGYLQAAGLWQFVAGPHAEIAGHDFDAD